MLQMEFSTVNMGEKGTDEMHNEIFFLWGLGRPQMNMSCKMLIRKKLSCEMQWKRSTNLLNFLTAWILKYSNEFT